MKKQECIDKARAEKKYFEDFEVGPDDDNQTCVQVWDGDFSYIDYIFSADEQLIGATEYTLLCNSVEVKDIFKEKN